MSLLTPQKLEVRVHPGRQSLVQIIIGNSTLELHYEDALKISQWIRLRAKEAKRACGDNSRSWSVVASLDGTPGEGLDQQ